MTAIAYLYKITNTINDMVYIGVTKNPRTRMNAHACSKTPTKSIIKNAIQKYGRDNFTLQVLVMGTQAYCYELESKAIVAYNTLKPNGYNICTGGKGAIGIFGEVNGMFGKKHSEETREKIRLRHLGRKASEATKAKMRESAKCRVISEENTLKIHTAMTGRKHSPESIEKMRAAKKAHWLRPEYREKTTKAIRRSYGIIP
jgi:group I intron endonuclease